MAKLAPGAGGGGEEGGQGGFVDVLVADGGVVGAVAVEEGFVVAEEGRGVEAALVPDEHEPPAGSNTELKS